MLCHSYSHLNKFADPVLWGAESTRLRKRTFDQIRRRLAIALQIPPAAPDFRASHYDIK